MQQINKKKQDGLLTRNSVYAQWNSLIARSKKSLCDNHTRACYASHLCGITGVRIRLFTLHMHRLMECLETGFKHYWQCSISITMMQRQLSDNQVMNHYSKFGQLLTHSSKNFRMSTHPKNR
jgi:hypothetical protein